MSERELWTKKVSVVKFVADTALTNKWREILDLFLSFCSFLVLPLHFLLSILHLPTFLVCLSFLFLILIIIVANQLAVLLIFEFTHLKGNKTCDIWCVFCDIYNLNFPPRLAMQLSWGQRQSSVLVSSGVCCVHQVPSSEIWNKDNVLQFWYQLQLVVFKK